MFNWFNSEYPFTNAHVLNLDWILRQIAKVKADMAEVVTEVTEALESLANIYQPKLTAGTNITISSDNVISATGGGGASTWSDLTGKPFSTIGKNLNVTSDALKLDVKSDTHTLTAADWTASGGNYQTTFTINKNFDDIIILNQRFVGGGEAFDIPSFGIINDSIAAYGVTVIGRDDNNGKVQVIMTSAGALAGTYTLIYIDR